MSIPTAKPSTNSPAQLVSNTATLGRQTISTGGKYIDKHIFIFFLCMLMMNDSLQAYNTNQKNKRLLIIRT